MKQLTLAVTIVLALGVSACGREGPLKRTTDMKPLPVAVGANHAQTADELIRPSTQARPQRNVDVLYRSEKRPEDPFDKPPGADNGR